MESFWCCVRSTGDLLEGSPFGVVKKKYPRCGGRESLWCCERITRSVEGSVLDCEIVVSEFKLQLGCFIHFRTNNLDKDINPY